MNMQQQCEKCGKQITKNAKWCNKCAPRKLTKKGRENLRKSKLGRNNPQYGKIRNRKIVRQGYIYLYKPEHPNCSKQGYIAEHRIVVEKILGRYLIKTEVVHHINGNKQDNCIENLIIFPLTREHSKLTAKQLSRYKNGRFKKNGKRNTKPIYSVL